MTQFIGFILPPVVDLINTYVPNKKLRFWIALFVCSVLGYLVNIEKIKTLEDLALNAGLIFTQAQITYSMYWDKSDVRYEMQNKMPELVGKVDRQ